MGDILGSWLSGPQSVQQATAKTPAFRGEFLGLPQTGVGSIASTGRRCLALGVDWLMCYGAAFFFVESIQDRKIASLVLIIWFLVGSIFVSVFSFTPGQLLAGIQVIRVDAAVKVGVIRALARQTLIMFLVPPAMMDLDGRGLHDRATGTALVISR